MTAMIAMTATARRPSTLVCSNKDKKHWRSGWKSCVLMSLIWMQFSKYAQHNTSFHVFNRQKISLALSARGITPAFPASTTARTRKNCVKKRIWRPMEHAWNIGPLWIMEHGTLDPKTLGTLELRHPPDGPSLDVINLCFIYF